MNVFRPLPPSLMLARLLMSSLIGGRVAQSLVELHAPYLVGLAGMMAAIFLVFLIFDKMSGGGGSGGKRQRLPNKSKKTLRTKVLLQPT